MASCKYEKGRCKGSTHAKNVLRHNTKDVRKKDNHENKHINPEKTHLNTSKYGLSYVEACQKYDLRIFELDQLQNANKRKDRITLQVIEVPVPKDLPREQHQAFFDETCQILINFYGEKNLIDATYHFDEEHEYIDAETKELEMSRNHGHYEFIPEHEGKLNGKWFSSRSNMIKVNKLVDDMCQQKFGMRYMDGSKKKGKKTTEQLKEESVEALKEKMETLDNLIATQEQINFQKQKELEDIKRQKEQQDEREQQLNAREKYIQDEYNKLTNNDTVKMKRMIGHAKGCRLANGRTMYEYLEYQDNKYLEQQRQVDSMYLRSNDDQKTTYYGL